jgi:flavodoxin
MICGNTEKVVKAIAKACEVEMVDTTKVTEKDLEDAVTFFKGLE